MNFSLRDLEFHAWRGATLCLPSAPLSLAQAAGWRQDGGGVSALVCTGTTSPRQLVAGGGVRYTYIIYTRHGGKKHGTGDGGTKVFLKFVRT